MRLILPTFALCLLTLNLSAQTPEPPQTSTLTVTTQLVSIDAVVHDAHGNLVTNLDKDAFTLREDGRPVPIRYFNHDSDLPLTVGMLIDTSGSEIEYFSDETLASNLFLENVLTRPTDRAFVLRFDTHVKLLQPMTSSLPQLRNALRLIEYHPDPEIAKGGGSTLLYDAIIDVCDKIIATETGRRALIVMTDGDDVGSHHDLSTAIRSAQSAGVVIYSILYTGEMAGYPAVPSAQPSGIGTMQQISHATGGRAFIVGRQMTVRQIYAAIEDDLRSQYRIGFTPTPSKPHKFHTLDLRTTNSSLTVQSRTSYSTPE
jgi:VWFA-related protein